MLLIFLGVLQRLDFLPLLQAIIIILVGFLSVVSNDFKLQWQHVTVQGEGYVYYPVSYTTACYWCGTIYWFGNDPNSHFRLYECTALTNTFAYIKVGLMNGTQSNANELFKFASVGV